MSTQTITINTYDRYNISTNTTKRNVEMMYVGPLPKSYYIYRGYANYTNPNISNPSGIGNTRYIYIHVDSNRTSIEYIQNNGGVFVIKDPLSGDGANVSFTSLENGNYYCPITEDWARKLLNSDCIAFELNTPSERFDGTLFTITQIVIEYFQYGDIPNIYNLQISPTTRPSTEPQYQTDFFNANQHIFPTEYARLSWDWSGTTTDLACYEVACYKPHTWQRETIQDKEAYFTLNDYTTSKDGGPFYFAVRAKGKNNKNLQWQLICTNSSHELIIEDAGTGVNPTYNSNRKMFYKNSSPIINSFDIQQDNSGTLEDASTNINIGKDIVLSCDASDKRGSEYSGNSDTPTDRLHYKYYVNDNSVGDGTVGNNYTYTSASLREFALNNPTIQFKVEVTDGQYTLSQDSQKYNLGETLEAELSWENNERGHIISLSNIKLDGISINKINCSITCNNKVLYTGVLDVNNNTAETPDLRSAYITTFGNINFNGNFQVTLTYGNVSYNSSLAATFSPISLSSYSFYNADNTKYYFMNGSSWNSIPLLCDQVGLSLDLSESLPNYQVVIHKIGSNKYIDVGQSLQPIIPLKDFVEDGEAFRLEAYVYTTNNRVQQTVLSMATSDSLVKTKLEGIEVTGSAINNSFFGESGESEDVYLSTNLSIQSGSEYNYYVTNVIVNGLTNEPLSADTNELITISASTEMSTLSQGSYIDYNFLLREWAIPSIKINNGSSIQLNPSSGRVKINQENLDIQVGYNFRVALYDSSRNLVGYSSYPSNFSADQSIIQNFTINTTSPPTAPNFTSITRTSQS